MASTLYILSANAHNCAFLFTLYNIISSVAFFSFFFLVKLVTYSTIIHSNILLLTPHFCTLFYVPLKNFFYHLTLWGLIKTINQSNNKIQCITCNDKKYYIKFVTK